MKIAKKITLFLVIAMLICALAGCSGAPKTEKVNAEDISSYTDPAAEKIFTGISEADYAKFSEDFDEQMKAALPESKLKDITEQLGTYESKELAGADKADGYIRAFYKAKFSKIDKELTFTIVFSKDGNQKVSGLFYK